MLEGACDKIEKSLFDPVDQDEIPDDDDDDYSEENNTLRNDAHFKYGQICVTEGPIHRPRIYVTKKYKYLLWAKSPLVTYNFQVFFSSF